MGRLEALAQRLVARPAEPAVAGVGGGNFAVAVQALTFAEGHGARPVVLARARRLRRVAFAKYFVPAQTLFAVAVFVFARLVEARFARSAMAERGGPVLVVNAGGGYWDLRNFRDCSVSANSVADRHPPAAKASIARPGAKSVNFMMDEMK